MPKETNFEVGTLVAELKTWKDPKTGEVREYYGYYVQLENGAVVRFSPLADDRKLLDFCLKDFMEG